MQPGIEDLRLISHTTSSVVKGYLTRLYIIFIFSCSIAQLKMLKVKNESSKKAFLQPYQASTMDLFAAFHNSFH